LKVQLSPANREATFKQVSWSRGQDSQARPCLCLRLGDVELPSLVFYFWRAPLFTEPLTSIRIPLPQQGDARHSVDD
jgi:hypothetical protein